MAEPEVLYNFGVLTKRYELVSRTASQLAPGIAGLSIGFVMILAGAPLPLPFAPVLVGFWFALGKVPFGRYRGARVRTVVGPLARYWYLRLAGKTRWVMPAMWLSVAVDPAAARTVDRAQPAEATPVVELGAVEGNRRDRGRKTRRGRTPPGGERAVAPRVGPAALDGGAPVTAPKPASSSSGPRRQNLLTAVISVTGGDRFVFSGPDEQAAQIFSWGEVLKAMASEGSGLRRLQWVERATPQPSTVQEDWARGAMRDVSPSEWADYQSLQATIGTAAIHHDVYLGAQVETDVGAEADVLAEAASELAQLCEQLTSIGLRPTVLSRREIAAVMRQWADPTALERLALWGEGSIPTSGAGPAARHVGYDTLRDRRLCPPGGPDRRLAPDRRGHRVDVPTALDGTAGVGAHGVHASRSGLHRAGLRRGPRRPDDGRDGATQARREGDHHHRGGGTTSRRGPLSRTRADPGVPPAQDRRPRHGVESRRRDSRAGLAPGRTQGGRMPPRPPRDARPGS